MTESQPEILDVHSHFSTPEGFPFQGGEESDTFGDDVETRAETEMVADLREANVKPMLDFSFTPTVPVTAASEKHDYFADLYSSHPERFVGLWVHLDPRDGQEAVDEFERCLTSLDIGITGFTLNGSTTNVAADDELYDPFYDLCLEHDAPVLVNIGYSGLGAGQPGGDGHLVEKCHPKYLDRAAVAYPDLTFIAGRPGWPWQGEAIATLLHKGNIAGNELHGWRPKYYPDELTYDIGRRLSEKVMFGGDYPLLDYETLREDWDAMDISEEVRDMVFYENAARVLGQFGEI